MRVAILGTGGALSSARRRSTSLVVRSGSTLLLVDCSGNPVSALDRVGLDPTRLEHVLLTHRHTDHLYGLPSLIHQLAIATRGAMGGRRTLTVRGPEEALDVAARLLDAVGLGDRDEGPEVRLEALPLRETAATVGDLEVTTFPVAHGEVPTLGVRVEPRSRPGSALVYSSDTEPCEAVRRWSDLGATLLVHECSALGDQPMAGHSCLAEIEALVERSGVPRVLLVHLPPASRAAEAAAAARLERRFGARVRLAEDFEVAEV